MIHRNNSTITTEWTKKDIASNRLLNFHSNHPRHQKINTAKNLISKALKITHPSLINSIKSKIYTILKENWYPIKIINNLWYSEFNKLNNENQTINNENLTSPNSGENTNSSTAVTTRPTHNNIASTSSINRNLITNYFAATNSESTPQNVTPTAPISTTTQNCLPVRHYSVTHIHGLTEKLQKYFKQSNLDHIKFANKPRNQLNNIFSKTKDNIPIMDQNDVIYKIKCKQCTNKYYIGETSQHLSARITQHKTNCNSKIKKYNLATGLSTHSTIVKHNFDFNKPEVLYTEKNDTRRKILESLYITKNLNDTVNNHSDTNNMNFFYANTIQKLNFR